MVDTILCSLPSKHIAFSPPLFCIHHLNHNGPSTKQIQFNYLTKGEGNPSTQVLVFKGPSSKMPHFQCYHPQHCEHKFTCMTVFAYGRCAFRFGIIVYHYRIYFNPFLTKKARQNFTYATGGFVQEKQGPYQDISYICAVCKWEHLHMVCFRANLP